MSNFIMQQAGKQFLEWGKSRMKDVELEIVPVDEDTAQLRFLKDGKPETGLNVPYGKRFEASKLIEGILKAMSEDAKAKKEEKR